ncbi:MAG: endonuclease/exonuclease/phosphatase family protein [Parvibaculum sp.]
MTRDHLRVLSWNIHGGVGPDRRYDLQRIVDLVAAHDPDVIALQEIDSRGAMRACAPLAILKESLGDHAAEARTISAPDGHYGHAVISRFALSDTRVCDLSIRAREPRCAISTEVATPHGAVRLVTTHLGLSVWERRRQAALLADLAGPGDLPCILMGDFNDWFWFGSVRRRLKAVLPSRTMDCTFPAARPLFRLDRVYCCAPASIENSWTDERAAEISDHLPIIADISLGPRSVSGDVSRPSSECPYRAPAAGLEICPS